MPFLPSTKYVSVLSAWGGVRCGEMHNIPSNICQPRRAKQYSDDTKSVVKNAAVAQMTQCKGAKISATTGPLGTGTRVKTVSKVSLKLMRTQRGREYVPGHPGQDD